MATTDAVSRVWIVTLVQEIDDAMTRALVTTTADTVGVYRSFDGATAGLMSAKKNYINRALEDCDSLNEIPNEHQHHVVEVESEDAPDCNLYMLWEDISDGDVNVLFEVFTKGEFLPKKAWFTINDHVVVQ